MGSEDRVALVTGASEGIGVNIADTLARSGWRVFGTSRTARPDRDGVAMRVLDVTEPASVQACVDGVLAETGRVDLLVNNAAYFALAPSEELPLDRAQRMMDTNFFGSVRMARAVLPNMRARGSGRLIHISSLSGLIGIPGQGFYCSSKHALEGYAAAQRLELRSLGIHVSLIEPGSHKTEILNKAEPPTWPLIGDYDQMRGPLRQVITERTAEGADPQQVADVVQRVATARRPALRYRVNREGYFAVLFKSTMPEGMFYDNIGQMFGLP